MVSDLLKISDVEGEPRILDTDLAARLGFARPRAIRQIIARHRDALSQMGTCHAVWHVIKGNQTEVYYLNRKQAIFITAKSDTEQATDITIEIIHRFDAYEKGEISLPAAQAPDLPATPRAVTSCFRGYLGVAKLIGLDDNQAALSAARATKTETGVDPLERLGVTHLLATQQAALLTPTDIGNRLGGLSARKANALLQERGFQLKRSDLHGDPVWEPTQEGAPFAVFQDTAKRHSDGTPVRQLKWSAEIVAILEMPPLLEGIR